MFVKDIIKVKGTRVITARPDDTITQAATIMKQKEVGAIIITDDKNKLIGILSERDMARAIPDHGDDLPKLQIKELMTSDVVTCHLDDTIDEIMKLMTSGRFRHIPVVEQEKIVGTISIGDVVKSRLAHLEHQTNHMRDFIGGRGY